MTSRAAALALALALAGGEAHALAEPRREVFVSGGTPVSTEWFEPASEPALGSGAPAVVLLHGGDGMSNPERYRFGARALAAAGYHVVIVHYFDRTGTKRANWGSLREDAPLWLGAVRDALGFVAARPGVDAQRLAIVGFSLGASLALAAAADDPRIKAVVDVVGPLPAGAETARRTPPVLILHGARDRIVPVDNAHRLEALLKARGVPYEITIYPDEGHGFSMPTQIDAAGRILAFLERHLRAGS
jgi:dipeptidyl aminopeptidase/acylaminoacyl peptidase